MGSKNVSLRHVFRIASGIIAIILLFQAVQYAGAQSNNDSSETGVTYTQDVPFSTESIAQVRANESKQPAPEQRSIPFYKAPQTKELKQGKAPLKPMRAVQNELFPSLAPVIGSSFIGITSDGSSIPPDTMGAAGPSYLMEITNQKIGFFNKSTGAFISSVSLEDFWSSLGTGSGLPDNFPFDPKVIYDQHSGRFIAVTMGGSSSPGSWLMIAVSNTSDPTGTWYKRAIAADKDGGVQLFNNWADYPGFGVDANYVYVTANMFNNTNTYQYGKVWVIPKTQLLSGNASITVTEFRNPPGSGFTMQPAYVFGSSSTEYLIEEGYSSSDLPPRRFLNINSITFPGGTPTWTNLGYIEVSSYPTSPFPEAPQLGSSNLIDTNDARLLNAVFRNGYLWTTHTVANSANTKTEAAWYQINPATASPSPPYGTPVQQGRISDASRWYYFPSIAVNVNGDVGIGFSGSSASEYAGAYYTARNASDALGTMQSVGLLKAGLAPYSRNRWGDFSATVVDPIDDSTFWTVQEYAGTSNLWGTWWGKFDMGYGVNLAVDSRAKTTKEGINATYTLTLTNSGRLTDTFNLTVDNPDSAQLAALNPSGNITLPVNAIQTLLLNVTNNKLGTLKVNVTASSNNDTTKFMFINTTTTVANYSVNLTVDTTTQSTPAGINATYTLFLQNNGTGGDSYMLAVDNQDNAARANLSIVSPVFVSSGATRNFTLNVTNSAAGNFSVNVTASSNNDTSKLMYINTTTTVTTLKGDVNGDGQVTIVDALFIAQYTVGTRALTPAQLAAADVNGDGQVTVVDALFIAQFTVGTRTL